MVVSALRALINVYLFCNLRHLIVEHFSISFALSRAKPLI